MRRGIVYSLLVLGLTLLSVPARAVDEWKGLYLDAREQDLKNGRHAEALKRLSQAIALKLLPTIADERTLSEATLTTLGEILAAYRREAGYGTETDAA